MSTRAEKLRRVLELKDPVLRAQRLMNETAMLETLKKMDIAKGEDGQTPVRGVNYFTPEDVQYIVSLVLSKVKNGTDGKPGKNGETPVAGVHFFTEYDKKMMAKEAAALVKVPKPKDGVSPDPKIVAEQALELMMEKKKIGLKDIHDLDKLVEFLKLGGFRGGGSSSGGGTTTFYGPETPSGLIDGVNTTYTTTSIITKVINFAINGQYIAPSDYTFTGNTITFNAPIDASLSGLPFTIIYV